MKTDYRKIDIYVDGEYKASTTWSKTCQEAKAQYSEKYPDIIPALIKCYFAKD